MIFGNSGVEWDEETFTVFIYAIGKHFIRKNTISCYINVISTNLNFNIIINSIILISKFLFGNN